MSFSIPAIRDAIKAQLDTISTLSTYDTMPEAVNLPAAIVYPSSGTFLTYETMDSAVNLEFIVIILVSTAVDDLAQDELDGYLASSGVTSIKAAINANPRLSGTVDFAVINEARNYGIHEFNNNQFFGAELVIQVGAM